MTETETTPPNRTAKRRLRTRQQLLEAVEAVILSCGYADASAEAIAELADLGRSTFYNHFSNKQDAVLAMLIAHYHDYGDAAYVPLEETRDRAESVALSTMRVFKAMANDPLTKRLVDRPRLLAQAVSESQAEFIAKELTDGVMQGRFEFSLNLENLTIALTWTYVGMLTRAINLESVEDTSLDWARFLLFNLGIQKDEIEGLINVAHRNLQAPAH